MSFLKPLCPRCGSKKIHESCWGFECNQCMLVWSDEKDGDRLWGYAHEHLALRICKRRTKIQPSQMTKLEWLNWAIGRVTQQ
jgi:uncharacterized C2H2 Zn-finger protein